MAVERIDYTSCNSCMKCVDICPMDVYRAIGRKPYIAYPKDCMTCFLCEIYCEKDCIYVAPSRAWEKVTPY